MFRVRFTTKHEEVDGIYERLMDYLGAYDIEIDEIEEPLPQHGARRKKLGRLKNPPGSKKGEQP